MNARSYRWPAKPLVVVCLDGSPFDYMRRAIAAGRHSLLDALNIGQGDRVGNDSGGGIAQIFAASRPERVRSLTLTNCDTHDNWPPEAFKPFLGMAAKGGLHDTLNAMLTDKNVYRSAQALGPAYEHPEVRGGRSRMRLISINHRYSTRRGRSPCRCMVKS